MKNLTASEITKLAIAELNNRGGVYWRNNNIPVRGRINNVKKGVSDILGISRAGVFVACEVKTVNDRLSSEQIDFLTTVKALGGAALLATEENGLFKLKEYTNEKERNTTNQSASGKR